MNPLLLFIIQTSLVGSATAIFYLLLSPLRQKILSAGWQYNLVKMLALFFILPIGLLPTLPSLWPTGNNVIPQPQSEYVAREATEVVLHDTALDTESNTLVRFLPENLTKPLLAPLVSVVPNTASINRIRDILFKVWLTGAILFVLFQTLLFWQFYQRVIRYTYIKGVYLSKETRLCNRIATRMGIRRKLMVAVNGKIKSPMVFLGKSNTVVLPAVPIGEEDLKYVLNHELTHIKRHDLRNKFIFLCIQAIHWFNPLCHLLARQLNTWCELSCDEAVAKDLSYEEKKEYGLSIINLMYTGKVSEITLCSSYACSKKNLKRRLNMLIKKQRFIKTKIALSIACTILIGAVGCSSGVLASALGFGATTPVVSIDKPAVVLAVSEHTKTATVILVDDKQYTLDERKQMLISVDKGQTWQEFTGNYDTLKYLYNNLGVAFVSVEDYIASVEQMKNRTPVLPNINPDTIVDWKATIAMYEEIVPALQKNEPISHVSLLFDFVEFPYVMPGTPASPDGDIPKNIVVGQTLEDLYVMWKEQLDFWVELEMLTQTEADGLWKQFLENFDLAK